MKIVKFQYNDIKSFNYGIIEDSIVRPIRNIYHTRDLFTKLGKGDYKTGRQIKLDDITVLPPTDDNTSIFCAGLNYHDHVIEMSMPVPKSPVFFSKTKSAITGAYDDIIYPESISLLDYEVELGVIIGRIISYKDVISDNNILDYLFGITIFNDISARDQQLKAGQWFLGKNFRTFAPIGPYVQLLDKDVVNSLHNLELVLQVYDAHGKKYADKKQHGNTENMIFNISNLINTLRTQFDLYPGDIIATGSPSGVAMSKPGRLKVRISEILGMSYDKRIELFLKNEIKNNDKYLVRGDIIESSIYSMDRIVDLGTQRNKVI